MGKTSLLILPPAEDFQYDPGNLLDEVIKLKRLKNDAGLSRALGVAPPVISKIRNKQLAVGASLLIRLNEYTDVDIRQLRRLMGDRRPTFHVGDNCF